MALKHWISWEGGVNLIAKTDASLELPNIILHAARQVHTPQGDAAVAMIFWQPDSAASPLKFGFVSPDPKVASYLASEIFAGTPFQGAPAIKGAIDIRIRPDQASAHIEIPGGVFHTELLGLAPPAVIHRQPEPSFPIYQQGLESIASGAALQVNDAEIDIVIPSVSITGGPCAFLAPCGIYAR